MPTFGSSSLLKFVLTLLIKARPFPRIVISSAPLSESAKFSIIHLNHSVLDAEINATYLYFLVKHSWVDDSGSVR